MEKQKSGPSARNLRVTTRKRRLEEDEATAAESSINGKKRFCCSKCDLATDKLSNFNKHVQSHGSKQEFTCPECDFSSSRRHGVLKHLKHSHNSSQASSSEVYFLFMSARYSLFKLIYIPFLEIVEEWGGFQPDLSSSWKYFEASSWYQWIHSK